MRGDENELFAQYLAADETTKDQVCTTLVRALQDHAYAVCAMKLGSHQPDVVNKAVFKAINAAKSFHGESLFSTWFHAIVINECMSWLRSQLSRNETGMDVINEPVVENIESSLLPRLELEQLTRDLSAEDKDFIAMKLDGMSETEIANRLKLTPEGVRSRWFRIRKRLTS